MWLFVCFLSLSIMFSCFIHVYISFFFFSFLLVGGYISSLFIFMDEFYFMDISYWPYGLFSLLTVIDNAAMNSCAQVFVWTCFSFFLGVCLRVELLGHMVTLTGFPGGSIVMNPPASAGDVDLVPVLGRSQGEGNVNPLQYAGLGHHRDKGAWWATAHRVAKSQTT